MGEGGTCEWKSGSIQKHSDHIMSSSGSSSSTFRLFDHITVSRPDGAAIGFSAVTARRLTASASAHPELALLPPTGPYFSPVHPFPRRLPEAGGHQQQAAPQL